MTSDSTLREGITPSRRTCQTSATVTANEVSYATSRLSAFPLSMHPMKSITVTLIATLLLQNPVKPQVAAFGTGAEVKLRLQSGARVQGLIGAIRNDEFELRTSKNREAQPIPYTTVASLQVIRVVFPDDGQRRERVFNAIRELGAYRLLKVNLASGRTWSGPILAFHRDDFSLRLGKSNRSKTISYSNVKELRPISPPTGYGWTEWRNVALGMAALLGLFAIGGRTPGGLP